MLNLEITSRTSGWQRCRKSCKPTGRGLALAAAALGSALFKIGFVNSLYVFHFLFVLSKMIILLKLNFDFRFSFHVDAGIPPKTEAANMAASLTNTIAKARNRTL